MSSNNDPCGGMRTTRDCYGEFIAAEDLGTVKATVQIVRMRKQEFEDPRDKTKETKVVITFAPRPDGTPRKEWICGPLSIAALEAMFGKDLKAWIGKRITLYATDKVMNFPGKGPCVRVYGSPDIAREVTSNWKVLQRVIVQKLQPTGNGTDQQPQPLQDDAAPSDPNAPPPER
jgi:hypothetical protein